MQTEVVEKEQWLSALDDEIVDIHRNTVDPDCVDNAEFRGQLDFGAHAIRAGDKDRFLVVPLKNLFVEIESEHAGESAVLSHDSLPMGTPDGWFDEIDEPISGLDIDTGSGIGHAGVVVVRGSCGHLDSVCAGAVSSGRGLGYPAGLPH